MCHLQTTLLIILAMDIMRLVAMVRQPDVSDLLTDEHNEVCQAFAVLMTHFAQCQRRCLCLPMINGTGGAQIVSLLATPDNSE